MTRPRGSVGDLRRTLRDATQQLWEQGAAGVTWVQAVDAAGLRLGRSELGRARCTMYNLERAGELQYAGTRPTGRRPMTLFAPAALAAGAAAPAAALDTLLRGWCAQAPGKDQG